MAGASIEGSIIEVVLAKPVDKNAYVRFTRGVGRGYVGQPGAAGAYYPYEQPPQQMGYGAPPYTGYPQYPAAAPAPMPRYVPLTLTL